MKIAFTICSNNYLAQAKIFGDSLIEKNPDYKFYIGLVDRLSTEINYENDIKHEIILVEDIGIQNFDELWKKFNIIELNTCVKPMYFEYLMAKHTSAEIIFYFDPDIMVLTPLADLEKEFNNGNSILLTPHILAPIPIDGKEPFENRFLNYGIYNLGFLGLKVNDISRSLLSWWGDRTQKFGFNKPEDGFFVDQLWFNLAPLFFKGVNVLTNPGYNMGPWNLQERELSCIDNEYFVNKDYKLTFYHFSSYKYTKPSLIAHNYERYSFKDNASLEKLYQNYHHLICNNKVQKYSALECYYVANRKKHLDELFLMNEKVRIEKINANTSKFRQLMKRLVPSVFIRMYRAI